jgi:predicted LPLAT superfamily acyltransferase
MLADWAEQTERGSSVLISAMLWLVLGLGARASRWLVLPATLWFIATSGRARAASRDYLGRVFGRPARLRDVVRHFHCFGSAILDRVFLLTGRTGGFRITTEGLDVVADIVARHRGCVLLGAHLGSFEVLRSVTSQAPAPVWALMFRGNAGVLTQALERLNPSLRQSVIEIGEITGMLRVSECIARGEIVGILVTGPTTGGSPCRSSAARRCFPPDLSSWRRCSAHLSCCSMACEPGRNATPFISSPLPTAWCCAAAPGRKICEP